VTIPIVITIAVFTICRHGKNDGYVIVNCTMRTLQKVLEIHRDEYTSKKIESINVNGCNQNEVYSTNNPNIKLSCGVYAISDVTQSDFVVTEIAKDVVNISVKDPKRKKIEYTFRFCSDLHWRLERMDKKKKTIVKLNDSTFPVPKQDYVAVKVSNSFVISLPNETKKVKSASIFQNIGTPINHQ